MSQTPLLKYLHWLHHSYSHYQYVRKAKNADYVSDEVYNLWIYSHVLEQVRIMICGRVHSQGNMVISGSFFTNPDIDHPSPSTYARPAQCSMFCTLYARLALCIRNTFLYRYNLNF